MRLMAPADYLATHPPAMNSLTRLVREVARRNLLQTLGIFLGAGWGVLQVVDLFIERGFLPSWTFDGSLLALVLGLPVVLATAWVQGARRSVDGSSAERAGEGAAVGDDQDGKEATGDGADADTGGSDLERLLTWDRALLGGVLAFALLGVLSAGYMVMRVTGIGAPGTLQAQGTFDVGSRVVLADFESAEAVAPGDLITESLRIDLSGSEAFDLIARGDVVDARELMRVQADRPLDDEVAREVAIRLGAPGVITGEVGRVGSSYVITSHLRDAESGDELASFRKTARDSTELIDAIDGLAADMRTKVGESLRSVASRESLSAVTTTSLEALRKYTYVSSRIYRGEIDIPVGQALLEEAIALDSTFATANVSLAISIGNWGGSSARAAEATAQAFRHRDRLSEPERYQVEAFYYSKVGDIPQAMQAYRQILELDPTRTAAANNLADLNMYEGDYETAVSLLQGTPNRTSQPWWWNLTASLAALGRVDDALAVLDSAAVDIPESYPEFARPLMLSVSGEQEMAEAAVAALPAPPPGWEGWDGQVRTVVAASGGQVALARELIGGLVTGAGRVGEVGYQAYLAATAGWVTAWVERDPERAVAEMDALLAEIDLESIPAQDRRYPALAMVYALVGDQERLDDVASRFREGVEFTADPFGWARIEAAEALIAVAPADDAALDRLEAAVLEIHCDRCGDAIVGIGAEAAGRPERAIEAYERYLTYRYYDGAQHLTHYLGTNVHERLGALYEEMGDPVRAAEHYRTLVELWRNADPALRTRAEQARARAEALAGG